MNLLVRRNDGSLANKLWLKMVEGAGLQGDYYEAIDKYERVAEQSLNSNLMRYSAKGQRQRTPPQGRHLPARERRPNGCTAYR